jgi:ribonucleoside-diphosphate reductase alpha chain
MNTVVKIELKDIDAIPFQEASLDIWDKKYRLTAKDGTPIDRTMDDTYKRVARALADVEHEEVRDHWYERFLWALRRGAIPAGRVTSNAGALEHKPATSTINCTVSGTIRDSMDDILRKVHEAGLTLKAGCGIGYEHSTLRPRGAYVSGAGAYTSGPLSFMDIYDKMCFTVSSAGGRRGAQMGTFDVGHPDVMEFIRAKRENGRLRQFNLSLLITDEFMAAVRENREWNLAHPPGSRGRAPGSHRQRQVRLARMAGARRLHRQRGRPGRLQGLQDPAGPAHVGRHHDVDLRLRGAGIHPHRPRQ